MASGNYSDVDVSDPSISSEEENNSEKPFSSARHPFSVRDSKPILMNIRVSLFLYQEYTLGGYTMIYILLHERILCLDRNELITFYCCYYLLVAIQYTLSWILSWYIDK